MLKSSSSIALAAVLAASCTTVGPNFKRPDPPTATGYAMAGDAQPAGAQLSPDARVAGPWWNALGSAQLDKIIRSALADSPDISEAEANLRSALADASAVRGDQGLKTDYRVGAQRTRINTQSFGFQGFPNPTINLYELGITNRFDLDIFGKKRRASEAATARAEAEARRADAAYLTLSSNAALQAVRIAAIRAEIVSVNEIVAADRRVIGMIEKAQAAGGAPRSDSSLGETQLAQDLALLPPLERQLAEARHRLAMFVGKSPAEWSAPDFNLTDFTIPQTIPVAVPSALVSKRPDILAAEAEVHAATADIGVATASLYPDISLSANLTQGSIEPENLFKYAASGWSLAAGLTGPLLNGGKLKAQRERAVADTDAKYASYRSTVLRAFVEVSDALSNLETSGRMVEAQERAERAAQQNFNDARTSFELGAGPLLNVFDAGRQLSLVQREKIRAQGQRLEDVITLFAVTAADWR